jgi:DNA polymerase III subunit gamma/tau
MSYQVLARKWRPRNFEQMVGQTHVLRALTNALNQGRLHHAYLFTGTRGVGKTTLGRILAKCLNCEVGVSAQPCGECSACREIDAGRFVDLIEVDAASRTKVEDTRELLDNIQYAPAYGRYKVYLVDEVHMLSGHSFNALLKTLEEPPPHVKFLLATTDPQKLPMTVLSRCLQFNLKRMSVQEISTHLSQMLMRENIPADEPALTELARAADGSMRDALSLLDQAIGFGGGEVREAAVREMLGTAPREHMHKLIWAIADGDGAAVLEAVAELAEHVTDVSGVLVEMISLLHRIALAQAVPGLADDAYPYAELAEALARKLSPQDVQLYYQIALIGRRDLVLAAEPRAGLEMVLLRMLSFRPQLAAAPDASTAQAIAHDAVVADPTPPSAAEPSTTTRTVDKENVLSDGTLDWPQLVRALPLKGVAFALASNCSLRTCSPDEICLTLDPRHAQIRTGNAEARLRQALCDHFGAAVRLRIDIADHVDKTPAQRASQEAAQRQDAAAASIEADATVRAFKARFGAEVIAGSIKPLADPVAADPLSTDQD